MVTNGYTESILQLGEGLAGKRRRDADFTLKKHSKKEQYWYFVLDYDTVLLHTLQLCIGSKRTINNVNPTNSTQWV